MSSFAFAGTVRTDFPEVAIFGSGFVIPPTTSGTIGVPPYTVERTLAETIEWYWKDTKSWTASVAISAGSISLSGGVMTPDASNPVDELDLIYGLSADVKFTLLNTSGDAFAQLAFIHFASALYMKDGADYYPAVGISGLVDDGTGNTVTFNTTNTGGASGGSSITATVDGEDITLYYNGTGTYSVTSCVITVDEEWPYTP